MFDGVLLVQFDTTCFVTTRRNVPTRDRDGKRARRYRKTIWPDAAYINALTLAMSPALYLP
jgi:hypothetical protein